jgi:C-terminal processing protease CtpA/Prc
MRGYPGSAGMQLLHHLTDERIHSAFWRVPVLMKPDFADVEYNESRWNVPPRSPRLPDNIAFITDGRAISYAESCMAVIEAYELGEIVGARTAGTNGNINRINLAGGFMMIWTGMRVVKHDGRTVHQGVGVEPTVPCARTIEGIAAGRDEVLEKAVEVVRARGE